jgi:tetratricopeptide (TPR) repeat protein
MGVIGLTDYEIELEQIGRVIAELNSGDAAIPREGERARRFVYLLYRHASLTGSSSEFERVESALDSVIGQFGPWPDLYLLKAQIDCRFHRFDAARLDLAAAPSVAGCCDGRALKADLDLQAGRYADAKTGYESVLQEDRSWENLARLAYLQGKLGDAVHAEQLYVEAEDEITAKEMRAYAWVELQRGLLGFTHGCHSAALAHYQRAAEAYSGYWLVEEHIAEVLGAQGRFDRALALYEETIRRVPRPELLHALGDLYRCMGRPKEADQWHDRALAGYLESVHRGQVHYYHHLSDFYADVREDGPEAVKWAHMDIALRQNFMTQGALAWGLYIDGQLAGALEVMQQALSSGVSDAELFYRASTLCHAAGRIEEGNRYLQAAASLNPHYQAFHVHH